jgi:putative aminopeptidase FrvX
MDQNRKERLVDLCRGMVQIPSLSGDEKKVADFIEQNMLNLGFDSVERDRYGNVSGRISLGCCHIFNPPWCVLYL